MKKLLSLCLAIMLFTSAAVMSVNAETASSSSLISLDFESGELPSNVEFSGQGGSPVFESKGESIALKGTIYSDYRLLKIKNVTLSPNKTYKVSYKYYSNNGNVNGKYVKIVADAGNGNTWSTAATAMTAGAWNTVVGYITIGESETNLNATVYFAFGTTSDCNDKIEGSQAFPIWVDDIYMVRDNPVVFDLDFDNSTLPSNVEFSGMGGTPAFEDGNGGKVLTGQIYSDYRLIKIKNSYLKPNTKYRMAYKYYCSQGTAEGKYVKIVAESGSHSWSTEPIAISKGNWNTVVGYFTTSGAETISNATVYFAFGTTAECNDKIDGNQLFKISVDDVVLAEDSAKAIDIDFEDGVMPNRTEFSGYGGTPTFNSENGGTVLTGQIYSTYNLIKMKNLYLKPNTKYKVTYTYNCKSQSGNGKYIKFVTEVGGTTQSTDAVQMNVGTWNTVEGYITTPSADTVLVSTAYFAFGTTTECTGDLTGNDLFKISVDDIVMTSDFEEERKLNTTLSFKDGDDIIGVAAVSNDASPRNIILYLVQYDSNNNVVAAEASETKAIGANEDVTFEIKLKGDIIGEYIKFMAWDDNMQPYAGAKLYE